MKRRILNALALALAVVLTGGSSLLTAQTDVRPRVDLACFAPCMELCQDAVLPVQRCFDACVSGCMPLPEPL